MHNVGQKSLNVTCRLYDYIRHVASFMAPEDLTSKVSHLGESFLPAILRTPSVNVPTFSSSDHSRCHMFPSTKGFHFQDDCAGFLTSLFQAIAGPCSIKTGLPNVRFCAVTFCCSDTCFSSKECLHPERLMTACLLDAAMPTRSTGMRF
jgi:hypothetical protein